MSSSRETISIVLADKNPMVHTGLRELLINEGRFEIAASVADGKEFLAVVGRVKFDIGIMGWEMPHLDGEGVLKALLNKDGAPRIIVYTGNASAYLPGRVMMLGAAGFCLKSEPTSKLLQTISAVAAGGMMFPFLDVRGLEENLIAALTDREREMLAALTGGRSNRQLAAEFGVSLNTVKFHLKNLYDKLNVSNRTQAVVKFLASGPG